MKKINLTFCFMASLPFCSVFAADSTSCANFLNGKCYYTSAKAVEYAQDQVYKAAPASSTDQEHWNSYFKDYTTVGGNCTNFVSQSVLAGLVGSRFPSKVYPKASKFATDYYGGSAAIWAYTSAYVGAAWRDAHSLYSYAKSNVSSYRGMHFSFITKDSATTALKFSDISIGDVIFTDWSSDGVIDHTMIVTNKTGNSYNGILVSYQNSTGYSPQKDRALSAFNSTQITFHVYRPTFYSDTGY